MFKNLAIFVLVCGLTVAGVTKASATIYNYVPSPVDLKDLDHNKYYTWGITNNVAFNKEQIISAKIFIDNINNWQVENDILRIHLLDIPPKIGFKEFTDNEGGGDNFASWPTPHILLTTFTDLYDAPNGPSEDFTYYFTSNQIATLTQYMLNDNKYGLAFDPDCHYWNDGVKFTIETIPTPEPSTMLLMASGLLCGAFRLRKKRSAITQ